MTIEEGKELAGISDNLMEISNDLSLLVKFVTSTPVKIGMHTAIKKLGLNIRMVERMIKDGLG